VRLSAHVYGPLDQIPHDLAHYVVEMELGLRDGLWAGSGHTRRNDRTPFRWRTAAAYCSPR